MSLTIKWGRERISIPFPGDESTLGELRQQLAEHTSIPANQFKLVHGGAVMKDNKASLQSYSLKPGSTIHLIGSAAPLPTSRQSAKEEIPRTQEGMMTTIQAELDAVQKKVIPSLETFLNALSVPESPAKEDLKQEHTRLGELLLQSLLRLDAITPESAWEEARKSRKAAVKQVQGILDKLDAAWKASQGITTKR